MPKKESKNLKSKPAKPAKKSGGKKPENGTKKTAEKLDFILWTAMSMIDRGQIKTQKQFAKHYGLDPATLSRWKSEEGFWEEVTKQRKNFWKGRAGDVMNALYNKCVRKGNGADAKVFLQAIGDFEENVKVTNPDNPLTPEKQKEIMNAFEKWKK